MDQNDKSNAKKPLGYWEKAWGCIVIGGDPTQLMTKKEFDAIPMVNKNTGEIIKHGVMHEDRITFLEKNGYEITRQNMVDGSLSALPPEEDEDA